MLSYHTGGRIVSDEKVDFSEWTPTTSTTESITSTTEVTTSTTKVTTSTTEVTTSTTEVTTSTTANNNDYNDCGIKYGCFGFPPNCVASKSCTILVTFVQQVENGAVDFNLIFSTMTNRYTDKYFHTASIVIGI